MPAVSRRGFCALAALAPRLGTALPQGLSYAEAIRGQMALQPPGPCLLNSYIVQTGPDRPDFDLTQANAAYVYDNALAGLLLLAAGWRAAALRIGQALAIAQAHDRFYQDGRLRNAYQAGPMGTPAKLPGFWDSKAGRWAEDPYQVGSEAGPIAWAMLLWAALGMRAAADAAGDFLVDALRAPAGYYGGFYGFEPAARKLTWQSTEQNTDLFAAYRALGRAADAAQAAGFVRAMFNPPSGVFGAGLAPDGTRNAMLAADAGVWPYLAGLGTAAGALAAVAGLARGQGVGFSTASTSLWPEGTAFAALALARARDPRGAVFMASVAREVSPMGYVYASVAPRLATGLTVGPSLQPGVPEQAFVYYWRPALSATAWAGLAALGVNPLRY